MTVSKYFRHQTATNEQKLINDLSIEIIQQRGIDLRYTPRELTDDVDQLFGEDPENKFLPGVVIEMMPKALHGFEGEGNFMAGFGLDVRDEASFQIVRTRFYDVVTKKYPNVTRPREGDLISYFRTTFEITFVEHEKPFYQAGESNVFDVNCKLMQWSHEEFDDPKEDIADIPGFIDVHDADVIQKESDDVVNFDENDPFSEGKY